MNNELDWPRISHLMKIGIAAALIVLAGDMMLCWGVTLMWHNAWTLLTIPVNWGILTVALKRTEEKWLLELYGQAYSD